MKPSAVQEGPLVAAVELPAVRLTPEAAERVALAGALAYQEAHTGLIPPPGSEVRWESELHRRDWLAATAGSSEALIAELRLAGWKVIPPGGPPGGSALKGGV